MSLKDSVGDEIYRIQISVTEDLVHRLMNKGVKPTDVLSKLVQRIAEQVDENELIQMAEGRKDLPRISKIDKVFSSDHYAEIPMDFLLMEGNTDGSVICDRCNLKSSPKNPVHNTDIDSSCLICNTWPNSLSKLVKGLLHRAEKEDKEGVGELISMMVAYYDTSANPTTHELQVARIETPDDPQLDPDIIDDKAKWDTLLRTSKARLTIEAKHLGLLNGPFRNPYGTGPKRHHPMFSIIHKQLCKWFDENPDVAEEYRKYPTRSIELDE